jgi:hypothetical protein
MLEIDERTREQKGFFTHQSSGLIQAGKSVLSPHK